MRKIEQQMNEAVANNKTWQSANTSVHYNEENGVSVVRLHGNKIAEIGDDFLQIFDGGWQSNTTKSRLNALIDRFCNAATDGVFQSDFQWYIRDNNVTRDFESGYIFAWWSRHSKWYWGAPNKCPFFVSSYTVSVKKSIKKGLINILCFFILELLSGISGVSSEYLWGVLCVILMCLRVVILASILSHDSEKCQDPADKFCQGLTIQKYQFSS